jgi:excisionase family DNA binding protein
MNKEKLTMTIDEAGVLLGIGRSLAYQLAHEGKLPVIRLGKRFLVSRKAFEAMLDVKPAANDSQDSQA